MKISIVVFFVALFASILSGCGSDEASQADTVEIRAMSQNVYIGASVARLAEGASPSELLETVRQTNFEERAAQIAQQIKSQEPDLIGLQEVADITVSEDGEETLRLDYLEILLAALEEQGLDYDVAASVNNLEGTLPLGLTSSIQVTDRDVTLYRTATTSVANPIQVNYADSASFGVAIFTLDSLRGYTSVEATVGGETVLFVNTHFEVQDTPCGGESEGPACQELQAQELADALEPSGLPVVLVGDINAEIDEPTYEILGEAGFENTWDLAQNEGSGATCCFSETLDDESGELDQRIDHILIRIPGTAAVGVTAKVVGDSVEDRTESGLWPADHAAPFATIELEQTEE